MPYGALQSENEDIQVAQAVGVEGGRKNEGSDVLCLLSSGVLTKNPENTAERKILLQKVEVGLERKASMNA